MHTQTHTVMPHTTSMKNKWKKMVRKVTNNGKNGAKRTAKKGLTYVK